MPPLPQLSPPHAAGLARWTLGMGRVRSWALSAVRGVRAAGWQGPANPLRPRLREGDLEARATRGAPRRQIEVEACVAPLLHGVLTSWQGTPIALALDARS